MIKLFEILLENLGLSNITEFNYEERGNEILFKLTDKNKVLIAICKSIEIVDEELHLSRIEVVKNWRGRGVGYYFVRQVIQFATNAGYKKLSLNVLMDNTIAISLYKKLGFRIDGQSLNVHNFEEDTYSMVLPL